MPQLASLALYNTNFVSIEGAMQWIYDEDDNDYEAPDAMRKMRHPFVASLPQTNEFVQANIQYLNQDNEGGGVGASLECYICKFERARHKEDGGPINAKN